MTSSVDWETYSDSVVLGGEEVVRRAELISATTWRSHLKKQLPEQKRLCKFLVKKPVRAVAAQARPPVPRQKHANIAAARARFDINRDFLPSHEHANDAGVTVKRLLIHVTLVVDMAVWVGNEN